MSQFTLFYPQDITFSVRAMFRVCEMTALCIRSRIQSRIIINIIIIIIIIITIIIILLLLLLLLSLLYLLLLYLMQCS